MSVRIGLSQQERSRFGLADLVLAVLEPGLPGMSELHDRSMAVVRHFRAFSMAASAVAGCAEEEVNAHPCRFRLPAEVLWDRTMVTSSGSKGGYLVGSEIGELVPTLRGRGVVARLPVKRLNGLHSNMTLPRGATSVTANWQSGDGSSNTASDLGVGDLSLAPKMLVVIVELSIALLKGMGAAANDFLLAEIQRAADEAQDKAFIAGAGGREPLGVMNATGVNNQPGASLAWSSVLDMLRLAETYATDDSLTWLVAPDTARVLRGREKAAGSGYIMEGNAIGDVPAIVSNNVPAGSLVIAPWSTATVASWSAAQFSISGGGPNFDAGKVAIRLLLEVDSVIEQPAALAKATAVT